MEETRVISHIWIYPTPKKTISAINKVESTKVASIVLKEAIGNTNAFDLTEKQMNALCATNQISSGKVGWRRLAMYVGTGGRATATVNIEEHNAGDAIVDRKGRPVLDANNVPTVYRDSGIQVSFQTINLNKTVTTLRLTAEISREQKELDEFDFDLGDIAAKEKVVVEE